MLVCGTNVTAFALNELFAIAYISEIYGLRMERKFMDQVTRTPKQLGTILRRRRKEVGLSQEALASRIHLRQATISAWRILQLIPDWTRCSML